MFVNVFCTPLFQNSGENTAYKYLLYTVYV